MAGDRFDPLKGLTGKQKGSLLRSVQLLLKGSPKEAVLVSSFMFQFKNERELCLNLTTLLMAAD